MQNKIVQAKSFMTKTNIGSHDFTCNPFIGCTHGCIYCYAKTIERHHSPEEWGHYVDIKEYPNTFIPKGTGNKSLFFCSMTDPYQPIEGKVESVRKILESIALSNLSISILTKSDLVTRDTDLFLQMKDVEIGFSISLSDLDSKIFEPGSSIPSNRIIALKKLHSAGVKTFVFVSPILPYITNSIDIIHQVKDSVDYIMFDSLNLSDEENRKTFFKTINSHYPDLTIKMEEIFIRKNKTYYTELRNLIKKECAIYNIPIHNIF